MKKFGKLKSLLTLLSVSASLFPIVNSSVINAETSYRYIRGATNEEVDKVANLIMRELNKIQKKRPMYWSKERQQDFSASVLENLYNSGSNSHTVPDLSKYYIAAGMLGLGVDSCSFRSAYATYLFAQKNIVSFSMSVRGHSTTVYLNEKGEPWVLNIYNDSTNGSFKCEKTKLKNYLEQQATSDPSAVFPVVSNVGYNANEVMMSGASPAVCLQLLYRQLNSEFPGNVSTFSPMLATYRFKNGLLSALKDLESSWCPYCWPVVTLEEDICQIHGENSRRLVLLPSIVDMNTQWTSNKIKTEEKSKLHPDILADLSLVPVKSKGQKYDYLSKIQKKYGKPFILAFYKFEKFGETLYNLMNLQSWADSENSGTTVMSKLVYDTLQNQTLYDSSDLKYFFILRLELLGEELLPNISGDNLKNTDLKYFLAHPFGYRVGEENYVLSKKERQNLKFKENQLKSTYLKKNVDENGVPYYIPPTNLERK